MVQSSLGYFIAPLVNVLLGVLLLRERPRPYQVLSIALAAAGVLVLTASGRPVSLDRRDAGPVVCLLRPDAQNHPVG